MGVSVNVHGSCVSRDGFNPIPEEKIKVEHFLSRNNIVSAMMPPCDLMFEHGELVKYNSVYAERCMTYALNKKTVDLLMESDAPYLVIDFFDFCQPVIGYKDTAFSSYDYCFYHTRAFQENKGEMRLIDLLTVPPCIWYGYIAMYFDRIMEKYGGNVILNRLNCSGIFMDHNHAVREIPENLHHFGSDRYNEPLRELEEYVINRFPKISVIDITKYFIPDSGYNPDATPVHYEENYKISLAQIYERIIATNANRYNDEIPASVAADLLRRPVSDDDFAKIYEGKGRFLPFSTGTVLDFIFRTFEFKDILAHRKWIGGIYREYDRGNEQHGGAEALDHILSRKALWNKYGRDSFKKSVHEYLENAGRCLNMPIAEQYRTFRDDFDEGNVESWVMELELLSLVAPDFADVAFYLTEYYRTIDDRYALKKW